VANDIIEQGALPDEKKVIPDSIAAKLLEQDTVVSMSLQNIEEVVWGDIKMKKWTLPGVPSILAVAC
jgi:hypothetical protein